MNIFSSFLVSIGLVLFPISVFAENDPSSNYRVLLTEKTDLNISGINNYLEQAKVSINTGNLDDALENLKKARIVSNLLIN